MNNADKFKQIFGLYATELWAKYEKDFLAWLNAECDVSDKNVGDLISRQAAIEHLKKRLYETALNNNTEHPYYEEMADNRVGVWLNEVPTIDPAENGGCLGCQFEKLGQWRRDNKIIVCSECGKSFPSDRIEEVMDCFTYCPSCGSRMDIE